MNKKPTIDQMRQELMANGMLSKQQREANKAKFLEPSKIKDVLYRGQRRSPKADKFITTQDRATPSFTTDPEVANVYSRQLGWDIEHGPGSTSVPVHMQTEKPFDMRKHGEHASLDEFIDQMDHDLTVPTHHKKLGYEDLADILYTLDNSVFKGGAKHVINARDSKGYKIRGFDKLGDEVMSAGKKKDIDRILHELLPDASVDAYALADNPDFVKNLKKQGYDSIIHKDVFDAGMPYYQGDKDKIEEGYDANHVIDAYRPLHQNKIKSAIGNRGTYDTTNPDITKAKGGSVMGINVASDRKSGRRYADMIVDGHKTLESRNSDTLRPYVGKRVAIVRTGEGKAKAIGEVTIGEPMVVNKQKFRALEDKHHVPEGSAFDINTPTKHLYPMHDPVRYDEERDVGHGIVSRKVIHEDKGGSVPSEPGSTPIKEGHVRLYHQTDGDNLREIEKHGLLLKHAKGIEGPRAIYAGETPFYGDATKKPTLEFQVPKEHWDAPFVLRDVHPQDFISAHYPWHRHARYLEDESGIKNVLSGKFDTLKGDEGKAVEYIKNKYSTKKAKGGKVKGPQPLLPKETVKAYKLFRVDQKQPGKLFPLFVDANTPVEKDKWVEAKVGEMTGNKVKSKIGPLAYRPGWHAGDLPVATHIGEKSDNSLTAPDRRSKNQVWAEVEMPNDVDWQSEANRRGTNKQGKLIPVKAHITDQIPLGGHYRYKTNPNMTGNWLIGGAMKVNRVLPDEEVQKINKKAKVSDLPRSEPINLKDYGFRSGGNVQPLLPKFKE